MAKRENSTMPLSRFGVLVAQLESIVASASQQPPDPLLCFDLVSELVAAIEDASQEDIVQWQRKCEDALQSLLILGARRPVRRLASLAMVKIIAKGDGISIYSRASSLQGWLADAKRSEPLACAGVAQCLGELYCSFGRRITSGLIETTNIVAKMMKFLEDFVRQDALQMLQNALEGSGGSGAPAAYSEAFRIIMRVGIADKSFIVRIAAVRCLRTFASIGGPGLGVTELENACSYCVKALEDPLSSVRDAFAEALGALLALGMNPEAQMKQRGRSVTPAKKLEGGLQKHLSLPFMRACGVHAKDLHIGLTLSWVSFLQVIRLKYRLPDSELQSFALQALEMLRGNSSPDAHALACVLYILRVGVTDQMTEPTQRSFLVLLGRQLESSDYSPSIGVAALRTLSYLLSTLGEVPVEFKEVLDNTVVAALSHSSLHVRIEAALTLRALAEVDPTCVGGLISYGVTTLHALRESASSEKGTNWKFELDSLHGQATVLAALVSISPRFHLGYPGRLPKSVFEVSKKMLTEFSQNPLAAVVEKEAGWLLLASLIASMPKEELEDQVFDVLLLWAEPFGSNAEGRIRHTHDLISEMRVLSAAVEALTAFIKSFVSPTVSATNGGILLQPVLVYLSGALSYISSIGAMQLQIIKPSLDLFTIRTLTAYQSLLDPMAYICDHPKIIQICTTPFSDPSGCEESSCLRMLLDKRDACLGPWIPGRDWFEDELRALEDGKDGVLPCVWENEISSFPQPETMSKMLVNQMLLCFGSLFATQDCGGKLVLLNIIEQCLKSGKKQSWHAASITNICVGLLAGMKAFLALHLQMLGVEILSSIQAIFLSIIAEGNICVSQRRASSEGLGLLARLGNDSFTARMTRSLLGELAVATDPNYIGSLALSLGCIHRSAGGMALATLVPPTVSSICLLAKSSNAVLQLWSLYSLLLTIEAAGLSYVPQVQATLFLAIELILSDENGWVDLRQVIGRLVNAIVAALGPELVPGSTFFSRCKSVVAETGSGQETSTLLECVRFTQQLVLFAPQAVSVHLLVQSLLPSLSSRQPSLRNLSVSTLRHLIEKDPVAMIDEQIEENLFSMLNEETDSEIGNLVRATINRLLYTSCPSCPSRWLAICRNMALATSTGRNATSSENDVSNYTIEGDVRLSQGEDDENMISSSSGRPLQGSIVDHKREKHLRYRTRLFAAECLSFLPTAVGTNPAHFDLSLARRQPVKEFGTSCDWLVLHLQELISLAYQISTSQFEGMQPIGVNLLITIMDKFANIQDPDLPGHLLLEQYQAQLVSAVRSAISLTSGPLLLEAGLQLATKVLTSSIMSGDRVALQRMFSLITWPLNEFKDLYYPSFAEWVACKIKIRLLTAHASIKCYVYRLLREKKNLSDEYLELMPLFSNISSLLGKYWSWLLKDYTFICLGLQSTCSYKPFLDGCRSLLVSSKVQTCLDESWPLILQAIALDSVPMKFEVYKSSKLDIESLPKSVFVSGYSMVRLELREFNFLWGLALLILFQGQKLVADIPIISLFHHDKRISSGKIISEETQNCKFFGIALLVFQCLSTEVFFGMEFLTLDLCKELLQVLMYADHMEDSWDTFAVPLLSQIVQFYPDGFLEMDDLTYMAMELYVKYLYRTFQRCDESSEDHTSKRELLSALFTAPQKLASKLNQKHWKLMIVFLSASYECLRGTSTVSHLSRIIDFLRSITPLLKKCFEDKAKVGLDGDTHAALRAWATVSSLLLQDCMKKIHMLENRSNESCKLLAKILAFGLEEALSLAEIAHESLHLVQSKDRNMFPLSAFKHCTKCFQMTLTDFNLQIQTVGVHVLKSLAQKDQCESLKSHSFVLFFIGELLEDIFVLIQDKLKNPMTKESIAICEECLRLLFLFHTLAQASECRQGATKLFLEAIFIIISAAIELNLQELNEIRTIAMRMVTYLVQLPSFASQLKGVLLSMPEMRRQQLQEIIRAAFAQGENTEVQMKFSSPSYPTIKLPVQSVLGGARVDTRASGAVMSGSHNEDINEEKEVQEVAERIHDGEDDDDDWDTFQSIPAATDSRVGITGVDPVSSLDSTLPESESSFSSVAIAPTDSPAADRIESEPVSSSTDATTMLESEYDGKSHFYENAQIMVSDSEETRGEPNLDGKEESALESLTSGVELRETPPESPNPCIPNETIRGEHGKNSLTEVYDSHPIRDAKTLGDNYCEEGDSRPRVIGSEGCEIETSSSPQANEDDEEIIYETVRGEHGKDNLTEVSDSQEAIGDAKMLSNCYCEEEEEEGEGEEGMPRVSGSQGGEGGIKKSSSTHANEDDEEIKE